MMTTALWLALAPAALAFGEGSCEDVCGAASWDCYCDDVCSLYGDCCDDYESVCSEATEPVEEGLEVIGEINEEVGASEDLWSNKWILPNTASCGDSCGSNPGECWCDDQCALYGDCCADFGDMCLEELAAGPQFLPNEGEPVAECDLSIDDDGTLRVAFSGEVGANYEILADPFVDICLAWAIEDEDEEETYEIGTESTEFEHVPKPGGEADKFHLVVEKAGNDTDKAELGRVSAEDRLSDWHWAYIQLDTVDPPMKVGVSPDPQYLARTKTTLSWWDVDPGALVAARSANWDWHAPQPNGMGTTWWLDWAQTHAIQYGPEQKKVCTGADGNYWNKDFLLNADLRVDTTHYVEVCGFNGGKATFDYVMEAKGDAWTKYLLSSYVMTGKGSVPSTL